MCILAGVPGRILEHRRDLLLEDDMVGGVRCWFLTVFTNGAGLGRAHIVAIVLLAYFLKRQRGFLHHLLRHNGVRQGWHKVQILSFLFYCFLYFLFLLLLFIILGLFYLFWLKFVKIRLLCDALFFHDRNLRHCFLLILIVIGEPALLIFSGDGLRLTFNLTDTAPAHKVRKRVGIF